MKEKLNADLYTKVEILICYIYLVFSFAFLDVWLRVVTRWINTYSIYSLAPNLFTLLWAVLLTALLSMIPSPKVSRIAWCALLPFHDLCRCTIRRLSGNRKVFIYQRLSLCRRGNGLYVLGHQFVVAWFSASGHLAVDNWCDWSAVLSEEYV